MGTVELLLKIVVWYHQGYKIIIDMSLGGYSHLYPTIDREVVENMGRIININSGKKFDKLEWESIQKTV